MTLQVGDKTVVIPLRDGGRVTVRSGAISVGDKAVLIPGANGQLYAVRPASPQVGDKVILYPLRNGGHVCLASADGGTQSDPVHVCDAWHRQVEYSGEVVTYGPISYAWDGQGQVYVSASPSEVIEIQVDDHLDISGPQGSMSFLYCYSNPTIADITAVLRPGSNAITMSIRDKDTGAGPQANIGALTSLYIMRGR